MAWWKNALETTVKRIDRALDIKEDPNAPPVTVAVDGGDFFSSFLGAPSPSRHPKAASAPPQQVQLQPTSQLQSQPTSQPQSQPTTQPQSQAQTPPPSAISSLPPASAAAEAARQSPPSAKDSPRSPAGGVSPQATSPAPASAKQLAADGPAATAEQAEFFPNSAEPSATSDTDRGETQADTVKATEAQPASPQSQRPVSPSPPPRIQSQSQAVPERASDGEEPGSSAEQPPVIAPPSPPAAEESASRDPDDALPEGSARAAAEVPEIPQDFPSPPTPRAETSTADAVESELALTRVSPPPALKEGEVVSPETAAAYAQKVAELSIVLAAREEKILSLTTAWDSLNETNSILRSQIEQLEQQLQHDQRDEVDRLTAEFAERIGALEQKYRETSRDRDALRLQLQEFTTTQTSLASETEATLRRELQSKEEQVQLLMAEGKRYSDMNVKSANINKKLQAKNQELEEKMTKLNKKLADLEDAHAKVVDELSAKREAEKLYQKSNTEVAAVAESQSKELREARAELQQMQERNSALQASVDSAYKELEQLARDKADAEARVRAAEELAAAKVQESLQAAAAEHHKQLALLEEDHRGQLEEIRGALKRAEAQSIRKEKSLNEELQSMQQRLHEAEERCQELSASTLQATRPLLRQIATLQENAATQQESFEAVEANLMKELQVLKGQLAAAEERERETKLQSGSEHAKVTALQEKLATARKDFTRVQEELLQQTQKLGDRELELSELRARLEAQTAASAAAEQNLRSELDRLSRQHALELQAMEERHKKVVNDLQSHQQEMQMEQQQQQQQQRKATLAADRRGHSRHNSGASLAAASEGPSDAALDFERPTPSSLSHSTLAGEVRRNNVVASLQAQLNDLETNRNALAEEVVQLVARNETMSERLAKLETLEKEHTALESRYQHMLVMYGEKAEEAQELKLDLEDVRATYQLQIQQLAARLEELK